MSTVYQFEISHRSGLIDCLSVSAECIATAWRTAERLTGAGTVNTVRIRNPEAFRDQLWHPMPEARRLEHINRIAA